MNLISIRENSGIPKYKQIIGSIEESIENGDIKKGDRLPSINSIRSKFSLSRDTVLLAFNELKIRGIVQSIAGKGYYVKSDSVSTLQRVFLLFDELNSFKEDLYNSFLEQLGDGIQVDIFFHHFNPDVFSKLIYDSIGDYSAYIIMPANLTDPHKVLEKLPTDKVYILDQTSNDLLKYPAIFQNFKKDIFNALSSGYTQIKKYQHISLIFNPKKQPIGMTAGFEAFCKTHRIESEIINNVPERDLIRGEIFLIPDDRQLVNLIKKAKKTTFRNRKTYRNYLL